MTKKPAADHTPIIPSPTGAVEGAVSPAAAPALSTRDPALGTIGGALDAKLIVPVPLPTVGRIVLYSMKDRNGAINSRPAIVVNVFERSDGKMPLVNLQVITDGPNDGRADKDHLLWATSRSYDEGAAEGTWHWMPYQLGQAAKTAAAEAKAAAPAGGVSALESLAEEVARLRSVVETLPGGKPVVPHKVW